MDLPRRTPGELTTPHINAPPLPRTKRLGIALRLSLGLAGTFLVHGAVGGRNLGSAQVPVSDTSPASEASAMAQRAASSSRDFGRVKNP